MSNTRNIREPSIEALRDIVAEKQCAKFRFRTKDGKTKLVLVDLFTASAIVRAYDACKPETQVKIAARITNLKGFFHIQRIAMGG